DRGPAEVGAELRDVEVGVTGVVARSVSGQCLPPVANGEGSAISALGRGGSRAQQVVVGAAVVLHLRVAAEQARRPVRVPVVIECAPDTPGRRQGDTAGAAWAGHIDAVGGRTEADALVGGAAVAEHRKAR